MKKRRKATLKEKLVIHKVKTKQADGTIKEETKISLGLATVVSALLTVIFLIVYVATKENIVFDLCKISFGATLGSVPGTLKPASAGESSS